MATDEEPAAGAGGAFSIPTRPGYQPLGGLGSNGSSVFSPVGMSAPGQSALGKRPAAAGEASSDSAAKKPRAGAGSPDVKVSQYFGVRWSSKKGKWRVRIKANGKDNHIGFFQNELDAAEAFDKAAMKFFPGCNVDNSVRLNKIGGGGGGAGGGAAREAGKGCITSILSTACVHQSSPSGHHSSALYGHSPHSVLSGAPSSISPMSSSNADSPSNLPPRLTASILSTPLDRTGSPIGQEGTRLAPLAVLVGDVRKRTLGDSKASLVRTPSPGEATTPCNAPVSCSSMSTASNISSISTPGPHPSPNPLLWSPFSTPNVNRSLNNFKAHDPSFMTSPPLLPPIGAALALSQRPGSRGLLSPSVYSPTASGGGASGGHHRQIGSSDGNHDEMEALRGLVQLSHHSTSAETPSEDSRRLKPRPLDARLEHEGGEGGLLPRRAPARQEGKNGDTSALGLLGRAAHSFEQGSASVFTPRGAAAAPAAARASKRAAQPAPAAAAAASAGGPGVKKSQKFRGVTWDKVKQMWRVRLCLAGGGREHIGYFADEEDGARAYREALARLKQAEGGEGV